jgi:hypothetical protein
MQSDKCRLFRLGIQFASKAAVPVIGTHTSGERGKCGCVHVEGSVVEAVCNRGC